MIAALVLLATTGAVTAVWLVMGGVAAAAGMALWKLIPRVIGWSLEEVIEKTVTPQLSKVNERIDSHMNTEENSFADLQVDVGKIATVLDERTKLFQHVDETMRETQGVISKHMAEDNRQFEAAGTALQAGQQALLERLTAVDEIGARLTKLEKQARKKKAKKAA